MHVRTVILGALLIIPSIARAENDATREPAPDAKDDGIEIVNGTDVPYGRWPDTAAVLFNGNQGCTGTLIAPRWVVTAGHCADSSLDGVLLGTNTLARPQDGEHIAVIRQITYPNWYNSYDITLLELASPSTIEPRTIASGWARFDIRNGAQASIVGFGAIDRDGTQFINELQEAVVAITDADCVTSAGCEPSISPGGELGAGGMGTDACGGDSGGPIYVLTPAGAFLAGATSRAYADARYYCYDGGIYVRTDPLMGWFEEQMGEKLPLGPMPYADLLVAESGSEGETVVVPNDHKEGAIYVFQIEAQGLHGTATTDDAGGIVYSADSDYLGPDSLQVRVTDFDEPNRTLAFTVEVEVVEPTGCGCRSGGGGTGNALPLLLVLAALLWRRRRVAE